jgi:hypothetical protein
VKRVVFVGIQRGLGEFFDRSKHREILRITKRVRNSVGTRPGSPPDAVHVALGVVRQLVVDDMRDPVDINAAGHDICRDQDPDLAALESSERRVRDRVMRSALCFVRVKTRVRPIDLSRRIVARSAGLSFCRTKRTFCEIFPDTVAEGVTSTNDGSRSMSLASSAIAWVKVAEKSIVCRPFGIRFTILRTS